MAETNRIDVHQHLLPPVYVDFLRKHGIADAGGRDLPEWSAEAALALMDQIGTATAVLSGKANLAAIAPGNAMPIAANPLEIMQVLGRSA